MVLGVFSPKKARVASVFDDLHAVVSMMQQSDDGKPPLPDPVDTKAAAKAARSLMQQGAKLTLLIVDDDPFERDDRTDHEALKVEAGTKYAANYWLHMYPFRGKSDRCENIAYADNWY